MFAASKTSKAAAVVATDSYFPYVPLLLETTSTNGQQNNTFLDSSTNNFTITRVGTATQGSINPYRPVNYWSVYFSNSYLSVADSSNLRFGSNNFTIEAWVFRTASGATHTIACKGSSTGPTGWVFQISSADKLVFIDTSTSITGSTSIASNTWTYVAVVRSGTGSNQTTLYINGVSDGTGTSATTFNQTDAMRIGTDRSATNSFAGYVSSLRLSNTNLTLSNQTSPLSVLASTIFYSLVYNRFLDGSSLNSAITVGTGTPQIQTFQPFSPEASYTSATYGGSSYFNGTTDYLTIPANTAFAFGSGDFTVEAWIYTTSRIGSGNFGSQIAGCQIYGVSADWVFCLTTTGALYFQITSSSSGAFLSSSTVPLNSWNHVAIVRSSGTVTAYINGVDAGNSITYTTSVTNTITAFSIGGASNGSANSLMQGYISNLRVVKGTAVYTAAFTPPTAPVTAITNTSLLTNFTNAGIYDAAVQNNVITVGDAQASTTVAKWSPTSMKFDGTGDYLDLGANPAFILGSANWTVEGWVYPTATSTGHWMYLQGNASAYAAIRIGCEANKVFLLISTNGTTFTISSGLVGTVPINSWTYLAVTRSGTTVTLYVNGTSVYTSTALGTSSLMTGIYNLVGRIDPTNLQYFTGYLQDVRITKGVARTIATPTSAFPTR
jgi:hypothetical protein